MGYWNSSGGSGGSRTHSSIVIWIAIGPRTLADLIVGGERVFVPLIECLPVVYRPLPFCLIVLSV